MAFAIYLGLTILFLWPLSARPTDTVAYVGDSLATVYFIAENGRRLVSDPAFLFSAGVAYPHNQASLFEAHRLLPALFASPLVALSGNPILATNLLGWFAYAFNAWATRRLALVFGISPVASFAAGALFAFNTYAVLEQPRLNIILLGFVPLAIAEVLHFARSGHPKHAWRAAGLWLAQAYTENYSAIYGGALILVALGVALFVNRGQAGGPRRWRTLVPPALVAGLAFSPIVLAYARMDAVYDFRREAPSSMDLSHFFATQPGNWLYGKIGPPVRTQQQSAHFVGFCALFLGALTVLKAARGGRKERVWVSAAVFAIAALILLAAGRDVTVYGYRLMPGPYGWLFDHVPLFERTRIPERFGLLAMLPLSLLSASGIDIAARNRRTLQFALAIFLPLEHAQRFPWQETLPVGSEIPRVYEWLRDSDARAVVEVPIHGEGLVRMESLDMYMQFFHQKPILAAYLSFPPLLTRILRQTAEDLPGPDALRTLSLTGVDTIVYHQEGSLMPTRWAAAEASGAIVRRASFARNAYWLRGEGHDVVFKISVPPPLPSTRVSTMTIKRPPSQGWRYRASSGRAALAGDGDQDTQWIHEETIRGGESIEIGFGSESLRLRGVALPLTRREVLPTSMRLEFRDAEGRWSLLASYGPAERDHLVRDLMQSPGRAVVRLEGGEVLATGIRLIAEPGARSFDGWRLAEIEVLAAPDGLK